MTFEVFVKIGRNLISHGEVQAEDSFKAAQEAAYLLGRKTIGVRPAYSTIKPQVIVFKEIPKLV